MSDLVYMKDVALYCRKTDRQGRSACRVHVAPNSAPSGPNPLDAGLALITVGLAWWYRDYVRGCTDGGAIGGKLVLHPASSISSSMRDVDHAIDRTPQAAYSAKEKERRKPMPCNSVTDKQQIVQHGQDVWTST